MSQETDAFTGPEPLRIGELGRVAGLLARGAWEHVCSKDVTVPGKVGYTLFSAALGASVVGLAVHNTARGFCQKQDNNTY